MTRLDDLGIASEANPPAAPRLGYVERRAATRLRRRRATGVVTIAVVAAGGFWAAVPQSSSETVVAVSDAAPSTTMVEVPSEASMGTDLPSLDEYLPAHAGSLPDGVQQAAIDAQDPALDLASVAFFPDVVANLDIAVVPTVDRSAICMLEITPTGTGVTCGSPEDFEANGLVSHIDDDLSAVNHTIAALPSGTAIGDIGDAVIDPSGLIVVWEEQFLQPVVAIDNGRLVVNADADAATEPGPDELSDGLSGQRIVLGPDCAVSLRVYNAAQWPGIAGRVTDDILEAIAADPELSGGPLEPQDAPNSEEAVTWILSEETACGDLTSLGIPLPTSIVRSPADEIWTELDARWTDTPRVAIVLGRSYTGRGLASVDE